MIAIFKREIKNYLKRPLFWVGILLVIYGVFNTTSPYLTTHYLGQGEKIINDYPDTVRLGDVYEGYIPANPEKHREIWSGQIKQALIDELEMSDLEAQSVMSKLVDMELEEAFVYLEEKYDWYSARYMYEDSAYYKGTPEEINTYLNEKMKNKAFSFYYSRKFADFAGLFMCFFATIMLSPLFTRAHLYTVAGAVRPAGGVAYFVRDGKLRSPNPLCALRSQTPALRLSGSTEPVIPSLKGGVPHRFLSYPRQYYQAQRGPFRCCRSRLPKRNQTDE